ncbi:hypothetical protein DACRYDRAFT_16222 [Dacryopinax primogenitus]|uniref:Uncharacterized protein n=1 Tax=Dacryopinax primogenitus (strain DJM 731) TaxID=1858805 RepID=M5FUW6_DACPD|nr:uncharacterized protein DACRYDRAFT_16222 [Dacryopinax primogenitus]EJU01561.1 hypothetical protein DACRYDRAFT_16222 [Dacryopinax primogenitus]
MSYGVGASGLVSEFIVEAGLVRSSAILKPTSHLDAQGGGTRGGTGNFQSLTSNSNTTTSGTGGGTSNFQPLTSNSNTTTSGTGGGCIHFSEAEGRGNVDSRETTTPPLYSSLHPTHPTHTSFSTSHPIGIPLGTDINHMIDIDRVNLMRGNGGSEVSPPSYGSHKYHIPPYYGTLHVSKGLDIASHAISNGAVGLHVPVHLSNQTPLNQCMDLSSEAI